MDDFRTKYSKFSKDLKTFFDKVSTQFKAGAPATLQYVKIIPTFLAPNDPALVSGNVKDVLGKFEVVEKASNHVFRFLRAWVIDDDKECFECQIRKLNLQMGLCKESLASALTNSQGGAIAMSAGISGTNTSVRRESDPA